MPTQERLSEWRRDIVDARIKLADELPANLQRYYWTIVDCRETCIRLSGADFEEQLELIDREIERALTPPSRRPAAPHGSCFRAINGSA
jgi:hypothetical protein